MLYLQVLDFVVIYAVNKHFGPTAIAIEQSSVRFLYRSNPCRNALFAFKMCYVKLNRSITDINGLGVEDYLHNRPREILPATLGAAAP